jgi:hypothetical protein
MTWPKQKRAPTKTPSFSLFDSIPQIQWLDPNVDVKITDVKNRIIVERGRQPLAGDNVASDNDLIGIAPRTATLTADRGVRH